MKARKQNWKVCGSPSCPQLVNAANPCPKHGRPVNAHWSSDRDRGKQQRFRDAVLAQAGNRCERCGAQDVPLQAHHVTPTQGQALCRDCHRAVDAAAR